MPSMPPVRARSSGQAPTQLPTRPLVHLLSNGRYSTMVGDAGSGHGRWREMSITRWREDPTGDGWGSYLLLRDVGSGAVWSATRQPCGRVPERLEAGASDGVFRSIRHDGTLETTLKVAVAADRDAELRHLTIANHGPAERTIEVTSYAELVLGPAAADAAHPAFSKMFVRTQWDAQRGVVLATRRRRAPEEPEIWAAHTAMVEGQVAHASEYETDRARFIGRGRTLRNAIAMQDGSALSSTVGDVLDPVFSLRRSVRIAPGASVRLAFWTCAASTSAQVLTLAGGLEGADACEPVFAEAVRLATARRVRLGLDDAAAERCDALIAPLLYADPAWRAPAAQLERGRGGPPTLWASGISGDRPIVLLHIAHASGLDHVHTLLRAQHYWRSLWLGVDVVVLNHADGGGIGELDAQLGALALAQSAIFDADAEGPAAAVFVLRGDRIDEALRDGIGTAARVLLDAAQDGVLVGGDTVAMQQDDGAGPGSRDAMAAMPAAEQPPLADTGAVRPGADALEFDNGHGGFTDAGDTYTIRLDAGRYTPAPWSNVVANPEFGFIATAEGGGHTFSINSQQNPLTPWPNDPVSDEPCEVIYLQDRDTGELWSATALPIPVAGAAYTTRHGKGWTGYRHAAHGLEVELLQCVPTADTIKLSRLRVRNGSSRTRRLSITAYAQWALGANGTVPAPYVVTSVDAATGTLFARNAWRAGFGERVAFAHLGGTQAGFTADRREFLGPLGTVDRPAALAPDAALSGRTGAGLDPCAVLQTQVELAPGEQVDVVFLLGDGSSRADAQALVAKYRDIDVDRVMQDIHALWDGVVGAAQVRTPDRAMDVLLNGWLLYQTLSCRMWARTAYYQSSGAYGFRDQLQDVMALCVARPDIARGHLLRAGARQFVQGDVQHWWLPPAGQGIRTRMTDDRLWLPYVAMHYLAVSGDTGVLDAVVPFLEGPALKDGEHEAFFQPSVSTEQGSLYEHSARAIDASLSLGQHGLPLMGTGDWNDGMNRVGEQGRGESVWLGWLLLDTIARFAPVAQSRADHARLARWRQCAATVQAAMETAGWDGAWYRRAYYDDGTPLGSAENDECRIDAIAQSWSVMSGQADPARAARAMAAVDSQLVDRQHRLAMLFTPPFEHTARDPGYIKSYPPGVRENGGQYTHGSIWSIFAWAALGDGDKAAELFDIFNPIRHTDTPAGAEHFKVEPYVSCADVYAGPELAGRGGWTWYTGSAGWLYRAGLEAVLGFHLRGDRLFIDPCIPRSWPGFQIVYRYRTSRYLIEVENPDGACRGVARAELDGVAIAVDSQASTRAPAPYSSNGAAYGNPAGACFLLVDDGNEHRIRVRLG